MFVVGSPLSRWSGWLPGASAAAGRGAARGAGELEPRGDPSTRRA